MKQTAHGENGENDQTRENGENVETRTDTRPLTQSARERRLPGLLGGSGALGRPAWPVRLVRFARLVRLVRLVRRHPGPGTGVLWGLIMLARLFVGGAVGLADNFDGHRLLCQLGVAPHPMPASQQLWAFVTPRYDAYTWYGESCSAGGTGQPYLSTEFFPLWLAKQLTRLSGLPGALDLRMLGLIFAAGVAVAVGWTVRELAGPAWARVLIGSAVGLVAVDSAVAPYFISPFSEPAALLGMLLLVPALLRLLGREHARGRDLILVAAITLWTIGADPQLASLLVVVVPIMLLRPNIRLRLLTARRRVFRAAGGVASRTPALLACLAMLAATAGFEQQQSRWTKELALYHDVFQDVLGHSPNVPADLRALGLPTGLAPAAGSSIVGPNSAVALPQYPYFVRQASYGRVLDFYAAHPERLFGVADRGLTGLAATRPSYLGNYLAGSGARPFEQECRFCVAGAAFTLAEPFRWAVIPGLWLGALIIGIRLARKRKLPARARGVGVVLAAVAAGTIAQFWVVMLTEGDSDLEKHLVFVLLGTMLLGPLSGAALAAADQQADLSVDSGTDAGADVGADVGVGAGADAGARAAVDLGAGLGIGAEPGAGSDADLKVGQFPDRPVDALPRQGQAAAPQESDAAPDYDYDYDGSVA
jgi:hypothetical protein